MELCPLQVDDWCPKHQRYHRGHSRALALREDNHGEKYRRYWDTRPARPEELIEGEKIVPQLHSGIRLGDMVESALSTVGITQERVARWLGSTGGCGCEERKQKLNSLGAWATRVIQGKIEGAKEFLERIIE